MLKSLRVAGEGPVADLTADFGPRLNVLTGDNGVGKSFLLDICFWVLTGSWPGGRVALPASNGQRGRQPHIEYDVQSKTKEAHRFQNTLRKICFEIDTPLRQFTCDYGVF